MPQDDQDQGGGRPSWSRFWLILLGLLFLNWILGSLLAGVVRPAVSYTFFLGQVNANNVQAVTSTGDAIQGIFRHQVAYPPGTADARRVEQFSTQRPTFADDNLFGKLQANGVTVTANAPSQGTPLWEQLLLWFGPALLLGGLLAWWMRSGGASALGGLGGMGMGKSKARRYDPSSAKRTTFADVAGIDDVKNEVMEIVDFLRDPGKYRRLGAQIPRGVRCPASPAPARHCWPARWQRTPPARHSPSEKSRQGRLGYDRRLGPGRRRSPDRPSRCRPQRPHLPGHGLHRHPAAQDRRRAARPAAPLRLRHPTAPSCSAAKAGHLVHQRPHRRAGQPARQPEGHLPDQRNQTGQPAGLAEGRAIRTWQLVAGHAGLAR
jgi:hypothetical protein